MLGKLIWPLRYALSELRSEWLFGCGVALAVCSVLTPTMLLWGAKTGVVDALRNRLLKDPRIRELSLVEGRPIPVKWFEGMRMDSRVGFLVPCVRQISLYGNAFAEKQRDPKLEVAYLPSASGDPLGDFGIRDSNDLSIPVQCMVTTRVAEGLAIGEGDRITLDQTRAENGNVVTASFTAVIRKVVPAAYSKSDAVYLPLSVIERIEDFKDGRKVGLFGWKQGGVPSLERYDSVCIRPKESARWEEFLGISHDVAVRMKLEKPARRVGIGAIEFLEFKGGVDGISKDDATELVRLLASVDPLMNLHVEPTMARWEQGVGTKTRDVQLRSSDVAWLNAGEILELFTDVGQARSGIGYFKFRVSGQEGMDSCLEFLLPEGLSEQGIIVLGPRESGVLGVARRRPVEFLGSNNDLRPLRAEYLGLRLYARNLEDVKPLRIRCAQDGIELSTQEDRIAQVLSLDRSLEKLFLFIALAGLIGGFGALFTSLYLSIERSKRQFAVLQILGIPTFYVLAATMIQGLLLVMSGALASFVLFLCGSRLLENALGEGLAPGEAVCKLSPDQWLIAILAASGCALFAALISSMKLRIKDPAVVARSE